LAPALPVEELPGRASGYNESAQAIFATFGPRLGWYSIFPVGAGFRRVSRL